MLPFEHSTGASLKPLKSISRNLIRHQSARLFASFHPLVASFYFFSFASQFEQPGVVRSCSALQDSAEKTRSLSQLFAAMRLYLLPVSTRRALIYCRRLNKQLTSESSYVDRATSKAARYWSEWEEAPSGWKKKVTEYGNQAFKRIPYEEWGLKSIPPLNQRRRADELAGKEKIEVIYPQSILQMAKVPQVLKALGTERQALHRRRMWQSLLATPLTLPIGLIPM